MTLFNEGNINYWLPTTYSRNINKITKICKQVEIYKLKIITILYYLNNYVPIYIYIFVSDVIQNAYIVFYNSRRKQGKRLERKTKIKNRLP